MPDLTVTYKRISDESSIDFTGAVVKVRRYDFFIGQHGPFTERVALENFNEAEIATRVQRLKNQLQNLPR
jgi:hypothetical protein